MGEYPRLERDAGRRDVVGEGVQGLRLHGRHDPRVRRLLADELRGRLLCAPADEHAGPRPRERRHRRPARRGLDPLRALEGRQSDLLARRQLPDRPGGSDREAGVPRQERRPEGAGDRDRLAHDRGAKASITGRATVDGVPGVSFFVEVEDVGKEADAFRIVLGDGYAAGGILLKGNVQVTGGLVTP